MKKKPLVNTVKIFVISLVSITAFSVTYYATHVPSFLKPIVPIKYRWTNEEILRQIKEKRVDRDFLAYFERDPERIVPKEPRIIVAPADGLVKVIRDVRDRKRVVIHMSFWDVHVQRVPLGGTIVNVVASLHENQEDFKCRGCPQNVTEFNTEIGAITVKQVTSGLVTKVETYLQNGQTVQTGERLGFIFLGSHTVVDLPSAAQVTVKVGDRACAGETIIARY